MSWNIHYQVPFVSIDGNSYTVNIYEQDYIGSIVTLTGAAEPFTTSEDDDSDIFKPVRGQTGYIRIIDTTEDGMLLSEIIPENNTQKRVDVTNGSTVVWQGYLAANAFTQPWDKNYKQIELPVNSLLQTLQYVTIGTEFATKQDTMRAYIQTVFQALTEGGYTPYDKVVVMADYAGDPFAVMNYYINGNPFFSSDTINNEGQKQEISVSDDGYGILGDILAFLGLTAREDGRTLYLCQYDCPNSQLVTASKTWSEFCGTYSAATPATVSQDTMLDKLTFKGADNTVSFNQGARVVAISFDFSTDFFSLNIPDAEDDASEMFTFTTYDDNRTVYVQPHKPRTSSNETFVFEEYNLTQGNPDKFSQVGASTYDDCLAKTAIKNADFDGHYSTDSSNNLITGAFPCRWYFPPSGTTVTTGQLSTGLFLQINWRSTNMTFPSMLCYSIKSLSPVTAVSGQYIAIKMKDYIFRIHASQTHNSNIRHTFNPQTNDLLFCYLKIGGKEWNGTEWITATGSTFFSIRFATGKINSNVTSDMGLDEDDGWYIPLEDDQEGDVTFGFANYAYIDQSDALYSNLYSWAHSHIITDFSVSVITPVSMVSSSRTNNTYRQELMMSGFSDNETEDHVIGTFNNNEDSPSFVRTDTTTYLETCSYRTKSGDTTTQRPELHKLDRMASQYVKTRQALKGVVHSGVELFQSIYQYATRAFFGIIQSRNWRTETDEAKFLEIATTMPLIGYNTARYDISSGKIGEYSIRSYSFMNVTYPKKYQDSGDSEILAHAEIWSCALRVSSTASDAITIGNTYAVSITTNGITLTGSVIITNKYKRRYVSSTAKGYFVDGTGIGKMQL